MNSKSFEFDAKKKTDDFFVVNNFETMGNHSNSQGFSELIPVSYIILVCLVRCAIVESDTFQAAFCIAIVIRVSFRNDQKISMNGMISSYFLSIPILSCSLNVRHCIITALTSL